MASDEKKKKIAEEKEKWFIHSNRIDTSGIFDVAKSYTHAQSHTLGTEFSLGLLQGTRLVVSKFVKSNGAHSRAFSYNHFREAFRCRCVDSEVFGFIRHQTTQFTMKARKNSNSNAYASLIPFGARGVWCVWMNFSKSTCIWNIYIHGRYRA